MPFVHDGITPLPGGLRGSVMLLGSFDGMHRGHTALLEVGLDQARRRGVPLSILQCDPHPRAFFAGPSRFRVSTGAAQLKLLAAAGIDLVYAPHFDAGFAATSPEDFILRLLLDGLGVTGVVTGRDFRFGHRRTGDVALIEALTKQMPFTLAVVGDEMERGCRISTSSVRTAITAGDIGTATQLLGHRWLTQVNPTGGGRWQFSPDQILPPPGRWQVTALNLAGNCLADCDLLLDPAGFAQMAAPGGTAIVEWRSGPARHMTSNPKSSDTYV
ncbi:hypothetical protein [Neorhizobium galegae]|uniref:hypothetical protein n=1 Tax=Neorhizobium galegae TaxID=399 RepID=UPI0021057C71|nr:hypothetical protein [Neorhizobium galegae]